VRRAPAILRAAALALAACSSGSAPPPTFGQEAFLTTTGSADAVRVELRTSPQPPSRGTIAAQLVVTDAADGTPRDGLDIAIRPWMPAMNHGAIAPTVTPQGNGTYLVTDLDLYMPGHWQLRTNISGPVTDHVAPDFEIP
jgi:hypothetical protein